MEAAWSAFAERWAEDLQCPWDEWFQLLVAAGLDADTVREKVLAGGPRSRSIAQDALEHLDRIAERVGREGLARVKGSFGRGNETKRDP